MADLCLHNSMKVAIEDGKTPFAVRKNSPPCGSRSTPTAADSPANSWMTELAVDTTIRNAISSTKWSARETPPPGICLKVSTRCVRGIGIPN
jgi:hypothetical protein